MRYIVHLPRPSSVTQKYTRLTFGPYASKHESIPHTSIQQVHYHTVAVIQDKQRGNLVLAEDPGSGLNWRELLLKTTAWGPGGGAECHLSLEIPVGGQAPFGTYHGRKATFLVVLHIGTKAFGVEGSLDGCAGCFSDLSLAVKNKGEPTDILSHAVGLLAPFGEALEQMADARWHSLDSIRVIEEENLEETSSIRTVTKPRFID